VDAWRDSPRWLESLKGNNEMQKLRIRIAQFASQNQALFVGVLAGSALISAFEKSIVPAVLQAICALVFACAITRK